MPTVHSRKFEKLSLRIVKWMQVRFSKIRMKTKQRKVKAYQVMIVWMLVIRRLKMAGKFLLRLRRVMKGQDLWSVSDVVDGYNVLSVRHLLPLGAYDRDLLAGDLTLRFGREGETFRGLGGLDEPVDPRQVVYADDARVCCWLWNHRDSREVSVTPVTRRALFFVDQAFDPVHSSLEAALEDLEALLRTLGHRPEARGVLDGSLRETELP